MVRREKIYRDVENKSIYTDLAHVGFLFAKDAGKEKEYNDRLYEAFYQKDQNIGELDVLTILAKEAGLDEIEFEQTLLSRKSQKVREQALTHAYEEAQITGVPTFIIGDTRIPGVVSKEAFEQVIEEESKKIQTKDLKGLQCGVDDDSC